MPLNTVNIQGYFSLILKLHCQRLTDQADCYDHLGCALLHGEFCSHVYRRTSELFYSQVLSGQKTRLAKLSYLVVGFDFGLLF